MKVFKFGGAAVNTVERLRNLAPILKEYKEQQLVIIVSAMGKTTNALEKVTNAFFAGENEKALELFTLVKQQHLSTAKEVLVSRLASCESQLKNFFTEVEWLLHDKPVREYDYYYDQIVCSGELFSTAIVSAWLEEAGIPNTWLDVRDILRTDDDFRAANIDWDFSEPKVQEAIETVFANNGIAVTQGFIGATAENESTTLGREGSDYTAAVFANMLNAESLTIWKDVPSVMNADPKQFADATGISELNYNEVIEMAYYGAQVIHPKTIKPLENKDIPLYVKCFLDTSLPGTVIHHNPVHNLPPIIVLKEKQVMITMRSRDFSFIGEQHVGQLYHLFETLHIKPNLTQNGAISFTCVLDDWADKIEKLAGAASAFLDVQVMKGLSLLTIRHYHDEIYRKLLGGRKPLMQQQTTDTVQALFQS